jgi:hypothetical protein
MTGRLQRHPRRPAVLADLGRVVPHRPVRRRTGRAGAAVAGLVPALQATGRLARLGAGALAGRTSLRLGATWTTLVIAQVAFSVAVLPLAAELAWGTLRTGVVGPGFAAEEFATARVALEGDRFVLRAGETPRQVASEPEGARRQRAALFGNRQRELARRLLADPGILGVAAALRPPGEEPWVFVDIEGRDVPTEATSTAGCRASAPGSTRSMPRSSRSIRCRAWPAADSGRATSRRRPMRPSSTATSPTPSPPAATRSDAVSGTSVAMDGESLHGLGTDRWYEVVGVVGNLPVTTDDGWRTTLAAPGQIHPAHLQLRLRGARPISRNGSATSPRASTRRCTSTRSARWPRSIASTASATTLARSRSARSPAACCCSRPPACTR